jgi:uncharacterized membrane protein
MELLTIIRIIFGSLFILFIPGFAWTLALFEKHEIDGLERIALSFGISLAIVPLAVFSLNYLLHVKITALNSFLVIIALIAAPLLYLYVQNRRKLPGMHV